MPCEPVLPLSAFYSTDKNSKINCYNSLGHRILSALGYPLVKVEISRNQLYENISIATEKYTKHIGFTEEYLIFNSSMYKRGIGLRMDELFSYTPEMRAWHNDDYSITQSITSDAVSSLSGDYVKTNATLTACESITGNYSFGWDSNLDSYRRVTGVFGFEEGTSSGINTLFTIEQSLASQTYYNFALGSFGFDMVSWHIVKEWLELRKKMFAMTPYIRFDPRTQLLRILPEPNPNITYYGVVGCYVEKSIKDIIMEEMVYKHALALTKISVGRVREKFPGQQLLGGGTVSPAILNEGLEELKTIEEKYATGAGDSQPLDFFVG